MKPLGFRLAQVLRQFSLPLRNQKLASKVAQVESLESELADAKAQIAAHVEEISSLRAELERQTEEAGEWQIQALNLENENASMSSTIDAMTHNRKAKDQVRALGVSKHLFLQAHVRHSPPKNCTRSLTGDDRSR